MKTGIFNNFTRYSEWNSFVFACLWREGAGLDALSFCMFRVSGCCGRVQLSSDCGCFTETEGAKNLQPCVKPELFNLRTKSSSESGWEPTHLLFLFCLRLQNSAQRDLWKIYQRKPGGHHGTLRSWKVHPHEHSGWVQVGPSQDTSIVSIKYNEENVTQWITKIIKKLIKAASHVPTFYFISSSCIYMQKSVFAI